jgi:DNA repair exonuclease SbcCD ATPase subunit
MKRVVLKSLAMRNFRGEKERVTDFNGVETTIAGENGTGKSRHFDAFVWCLFGKDTKERKDYNIRTLVDGEPLHKVECSVKAVLEVDGRPLTIKRAFLEEWIRPRGRVEEIFKGNRTETFWDDVPVAVTEYQKRVGELINESVFKMITNPLFFASMKWQDQREQLFQLAGTVSDREIAESNSDYLALLDKISGKSMADFKKEIATRKRKLKEELAGIQPRIDQTQKLMPAPQDFLSLEKESAALDKQIVNIDKAIADKSERQTMLFDAARATRDKIAELKQRQQDIVHREETAAREAAYQSGTARRKVENDIAALSGEAQIAQRNVLQLTKESEELQATLASKQKDIDRLRQTWNEENAKEYAGDEVCATCGQPLPEEMRAEACRLFTEAKEQKLSEITERGRRFKESAEALEGSVAAAEKRIEAAANEAMEKEAALTSLREQLASLPSIEGAKVDPTSGEEYICLGKQIETLASELNRPNSSDAAVEGLTSSKAALVEESNRLKEQLHDKVLIERYTQEIAALNKQGKELAQQIADIDKEEYTMAQFTKARIDECERRINGLFTQVTFRLFEYTLDGNESETCIPLVGGVPFGTVNTAGQINAGLDIINTLARFHGVCAPIFIDGRESVNRLIDTEAQVINLVVSKDKELTVK